MFDRQMFLRLRLPTVSFLIVASPLHPCGDILWPRFPKSNITVAQKSDQINKSRRRSLFSMKLRASCLISLLADRHTTSSITYRRLRIILCTWLSGLSTSVHDFRKQTLLSLKLPFKLAGILKLPTITSISLAPGKKNALKAAAL